MKRITLFFIGFLLLFTQPLVHAEVTLPRVIGSNMVLQRDIKVPIWGWASPGEEITITLSPADEHADPIFSTTAIADAEGNWRLKLDAMEAGGPYILRVTGKNTLELTNVLFGEVWVCSGQSNMEWSVRASKDSDAEIAAANYPKIRLFDIPHRPSGLLQQDVEVSDWQETTPQTIENFSAVAYYFGRKLRKNLDVPIGLISTNWGGTRIEPWTPPVGFKTVPALKSIAREIQEADASYRQQLPQKMNEIEAWIAETRKALQTDARLTQIPENRHRLRHHARPTGLYNGMVHPIVPYAIRGAIWYQGESNLQDGMLYHEKMKALINGWREVWGQGEFPFYFVQLAPFNYGWGASPFSLPAIWEAQAATLSVPNTGMAVTTDVGNLKDIHPQNKQEVGRRLALWALAKTYGRADVTYSGPIYKSMAVEGGTIRLRFDFVGSGLMARDGGPLTWFEIAGEDQQFVEAAAKIDGDTIVVSSDAVAFPVAVRFGWHQSAEPNLVNKEGLPASPFRTHPW